MTLKPNPRSIGSTITVVFLASVFSMAQDKDTLWTKVTAEGNTVSVVWDKHHPWDAEISARGLQLVAKYSTDGRRDMTEPLGRATIRNGEPKALRFVLPDNLRSQPRGPVCLFLQLANQRVLPIRPANKKGEDTAGFRYQEWDRQVTQRGETRAASDRVANDERALGIANRSVANQEALVSKNGWSSVNACPDIPMPAVDAAARPYSVVPPAEREEIARRVCVHQVWYGRELIRRYVDGSVKQNLTQLAASHNREEARKQLMRRFGLAAMVPEAANLFNELREKFPADQDTTRRRGEQASQFLADWNRLSPSTEGYDPHFGNADDYLSWPSAAADAAFRLFGRDLAHDMNADWAVEGEPEPTRRDVEGFIGASMDAYFNCIADGRKLLKINYDEWQQRQSSAPQRAALIHDDLVRMCTQDLALLDKLKSEGAEWEAQLAADKRTLAALSAVTPISGKTQALNLSMCSQ